MDRRGSNETACALAIGGLDPGGGAGVLADVRAFAAAGVFGCAAITLVTVQSTAGVRSVRALPAREVTDQAREVLRVQRVRAIKVGALGSAENVRAVAALLAQSPRIPAVVDTPMLPSLISSKARARLLEARAIDALRAKLVPRATVLTVNVAEAEALTGSPVSSVGAAHDAAIALCKLGAFAAVVKGGHLTGALSVDVLAIDGEVSELRSRRLAVADAHGTGCTFASLVAGKLAAIGRSDRDAVVDSVRWAKRAHHTALARARDVGGRQRVVVFD
jgi:hydroxymethylpyrimidine/phosphomethylpyrimidine kinase